MDWHDKLMESGRMVMTEEQFRQYMEDVKNNHLFKKYLKPEAKILDVGVGPGTVAIPLSALGYRVIGLDNNKRVLEATRLNAERFGRDMEFVEGDALKLKEIFPKESFDCCIHGGVMEHFTDEKIPEFIDQQLFVAPLIICSIPAQKTYPNDGIYRNMKTAEEWKRFLNEFNIVETMEEDNPVHGFHEFSIVFKRKSI